MSTRPTPRTVSDMAKKLAKHTNAGQLKRIRAVQRIAHLTHAPFTRAVLALRELDAEGFHVQHADLSRTFPPRRTSPQGSSAPTAADQEGALPLPAEDHRRAELLQQYVMPTSYPAPEGPVNSSSFAEECFASQRWWGSGRCLGVYGEDHESRSLFVLEMIHQLLEEGIPTIIPVRDPVQADQKVLLPAAEVVDLQELPGGIGRFMAQLAKRDRDGKEAAVLLDSRHGLDEEDHAALAQWMTRPGSRIRLIYAESYAVRGWAPLMDAMLTYAETVFLSRAKSVDLQAAGVPADCAVPTAPGAGICCTEDGHVVPFAAPPGRSASLMAHQANILFGPCGDRPFRGRGFIVPVQWGDVLRFWSDEETDEGWTLIAYQQDYGVIRQGAGAEARYQIYSYIRGLRGRHPELEHGHVDEKRAQEVAEQFRSGALRFSEDTLRLDLTSIERDGEFLLYHQTLDED